MTFDEMLEAEAGAMLDDLIADGAKAIEQRIRDSALPPVVCEKLLSDYRRNVAAWRAEKIAEFKARLNFHLDENSPSAAWH